MWLLLHRGSQRKTDRGGHEALTVLMSVAGDDDGSSGRPQHFKDLLTFVEITLPLQ